MKRFNTGQIIRFAYEIVIAVGALSCLLVWLGITPRDIKKMAIPWPHWIWVSLALVLFGFSLRDTVRRLVDFGHPLPSGKSEVPPLREKVIQLARDLAAFLRELGPEPEIKANPGMSDEEILSLHSDSYRPERVHHGYMRRFRDRAVNLMHELGESGVTNTGIENYQVDPPEIQREKELIKLVEQLYILAAKMETERELGGLYRAN